MRRTFYHNYGGQIVPEFRGNGTTLVIHEGYFDVSKSNSAFRPICKRLVYFWFAKKIKRKLGEGLYVESLNEFLANNNIKLVDEGNEEIVFK